MFGRPSISRNTPLDQSVIRELMELHGTFSLNARNFVESNRVKSVARKASDDLNEAIDDLKYTLDSLADSMIKIDDGFMSIPADMREETETKELTEMRSDAMAAKKKEIQKMYKKGSDIRYIDARDHQEKTGTFKGFKSMGGRSYSAVETGKELLMLPHYQVVTD